METVSFGELEKDVGFLVHVSQTYPGVVSFPCGFGDASGGGFGSSSFIG